MTYIALLMMFLLIARLFSCYGVSAVAHPGSWFALAWAAAYPAYFLMDAVGGVPIRSDGQMQSLSIMVSVVAGGFFALTLIPSPKRSSTGPVACGSKGIRAPLVFLALAGLVGASVNWVALGGNLGYSDDLRQQWLTGVPEVTARTWYLYMTTYPAAVASGWLVCHHLIQRRRLSRSEYLLVVLPAISGLLWSLGTGGRQALGIVLLHYFAGAAISASLESAARPRDLKKLIFKSMAATSLIVLAFSVFVGLTGLSRAQQQGSRASSFDDVPFLAPVGQFIEYLGQPIAVHQAYGVPPRRDLSETGPVALAGAFAFGTRVAIGWRDIEVMDTNPERFRSDIGQIYAYGTRNVFYDLQSDFGYAGALLVALLLATIAHVAFLLRRRPRYRVYFAPYIPLIMLCMFWGYSNQFSLLMHDTLFWLVVSMTLWDCFGIVQSNFNNRVAHTARRHWPL